MKPPGLGEKHLDNTIPEAHMLATNWGVPTVFEDRIQSRAKLPVQNNTSVRQLVPIHMSKGATYIEQNRIKGGGFDD